MKSRRKVNVNERQQSLVSEANLEFPVDPPCGTTTNMNGENIKLKGRLSNESQCLAPAAIQFFQIAIGFGYRLDTATCLSETTHDWSETKQRPHTTVLHQHMYTVVINRIRL